VKGWEVVDGGSEIEWNEGCCGGSGWELILRVRKEHYLIQEGHESRMKVVILCF